MRQEAELLRPASQTLEAKPEVPGRFRIIRQFCTFENEASNWALLNEQEAAPAHHYAWLRACAEVLSPGYELRCVTVGGFDPEAIALLTERKRFPGRLECLGAEGLHGTSDFPHADESRLHRLVEALVQLKRPIVLKRVTANSPMLPLLHTAFRGQGVVRVGPASGRHWLPIDHTWVQPELKLSSEAELHMDRARHNSGKLGVVSFEVHQPLQMELPDLLEEAFRLGEKSPAFCCASHRAFYRRYAELASHKNLLRLCFMRVDGRAIAMQLAIECGNRLWLLASAHDRRFAECSPHQLLLLESVRYSAARGLASLEFLTNAELWAGIWTVPVRECVSAWIYPSNIRGFTALAIDAIRAR